jgi:hypothetical protein
MVPIADVNGEALAPESIRMMDYLRTRAIELSVAMIVERIRSAAHELETVVATVSATEARLRPIEGKWNIAEVVDHIAQTQIRGTEELRHLLAGRRPPLPPCTKRLDPARASGRLGNCWSKSSTPRTKP